MREKEKKKSLKQTYLKGSNQNTCCPRFTYETPDAHRRSLGIEPWMKLIRHFPPKDIVKVEESHPRSHTKKSTKWYYRSSLTQYLNAQTHHLRAHILNAIYENSRTVKRLDYGSAHSSPLRTGTIVSHSIAYNRINITVPERQLWNETKKVGRHPALH